MNKLLRDHKDQIKNGSVSDQQLNIKGAMDEIMTMVTRKESSHQPVKD